MIYSEYFTWDAPARPRKARRSNFMVKLCPANWLFSGWVSSQETTDTSFPTPTFYTNIACSFCHIQSFISTGVKGWNCKLQGSHFFVRNAGNKAGGKVGSERRSFIFSPSEAHTVWVDMSWAFTFPLLSFLAHHLFVTNSQEFLHTHAGRNGRYFITQTMLYCFYCWNRFDESREKLKSKDCAFFWIISGTCAHCITRLRGFICVCVWTSWPNNDHACFGFRNVKWPRINNFRTGCFSPRLAVAVATGDLCFLQPENCRWGKGKEGKMARELRMKLCLQPLPGDVGLISKSQVVKFFP